MLDLVAKKLFLTKGVGVHADRLTSFEYALRDAGISGTNLVLISSIFPPNAKLVSKNEGLKQIQPGQILFTIYSKNQTNEAHRLCAASVGIARPKDTNRYGYLSEYESYGQNEQQTGDYAEDIAAQMLASSLGIPFDVNKDWDEKTRASRDDAEADGGCRSPSGGDTVHEGCSAIWPATDRGQSGRVPHRTRATDERRVDRQICPEGRAAGRS